MDGYGFKEAGELSEGEYVENADGELLLISNVEIEYLDELVTVYNFEVKDWHTYYVSDAEVFVHNKCWKESLDKLDNYLDDTSPRTKRVGKQN